MSVILVTLVSDALLLVVPSIVCKARPPDLSCICNG